MICLRWSLFTFILSIQASLAALGQERLSNVRVVVDSSYVEVTYMLEATEPGLHFKITPSYLDTLGNKFPVRTVVGDVGEGVTAGRNKTFKWFFLRDLEVYEQEMRVALDKAVMPPSVDFWLPEKKYYRSGKITLPEVRDKIHRYELVDENRRVLASGLFETEENGYILKLPRSLSLTTKYQLRLWDQGELPVYSSPFKVRRRIPLLLRWSAVGLTIGATAFLLLKPSSSNELPPPYSL